MGWIFRIGSYLHAPGSNKLLGRISLWVCTLVSAVKCPSIWQTHKVGVLRVVTEGGNFNSPVWQRGLLEGNQGPIDSRNFFACH